jgi:hypothetical protein
MQVPKSRVPDCGTCWRRYGWKWTARVAGLIVGGVGEDHIAVIHMVSGFVYEPRIGGNAAENRAVRRVLGRRVGDSDKGLGIVVGTAIPHIGQVGSVCLSGALQSGRVEQERRLRQHGGVVETSRATRLKSIAKCAKH